MTLDSLIASYGVWALGLGAGVEGETVVILGGVMVHKGLLSFVPAVAAAAIGSFIADQLFFTLGRRFRHHRFVRKTQQRAVFARALAAFDRHPTLFVFSFRFIYGLRTVSPLAIGTTSLPAGRFLAVNAIAAIVWSITFVTVGFLFGQSVERLFGRFRGIEYLLLPVVGAAAAITLAIHLVRRRRDRSEGLR